MPSIKILILHSLDSLDRAKNFKKMFEHFGHTVTVIGELNPQESESVYSLVQKSVTDSETVVILVSPGVFASCVLRFGIGYALGMGKKLISIAKESEKVILPSWYGNLFEPINKYGSGEIWSRLKT